SSTKNARVTKGWPSCSVAMARVSYCARNIFIVSRAESSIIHFLQMCMDCFLLLFIWQRWIATCLTIDIILLPIFLLVPQSSCPILSMNHRSYVLLDNPGYSVGRTMYDYCVHQCGSKLLPLYLL